MFGRVLRSFFWESNFRFEEVGGSFFSDLLKLKCAVPGTGDTTVSLQLLLHTLHAQLWGKKIEAVSGGRGRGMKHLTLRRKQQIPFKGSLKDTFPFFEVGYVTTTPWSKSVDNIATHAS